MKLGKDIFRALLLYCDIKLPAKKIKKKVIEITRNKCVQELLDNEELLAVGS